MTLFISVASCQLNTIPQKLLENFFFFSKMSSQIQLLSGFNVLFSLKSKLDWSAHRGSLTNPVCIWIFIQGFTLKGRTPVRKILQHANQVSSAGK